MSVANETVAEFVTSSEQIEQLVSKSSLAEQLKLKRTELLSEFLLNFIDVFVILPVQSSRVSENGILEMVCHDFRS